MTDSSLKILVGADAPPDPNSGAAGTVVATNVALRELGHQVDAFWSDDLPHRIRHWNLHYLLELPRAYRSAVSERASHERYDVVQLSQPHAWLAARDYRATGEKGVMVNRSHGLESMADEALAHWRRRMNAPANKFPRSIFSPLVESALHRHIDLVVKYADGIIVPASDIRDRLIDRHGAAPDRVMVVHHGVPDTFLETPRPQLDSERLKRVLHVGQFSFIKGPRLMVDAVQAALSADPELRFTWVCGDAHHEEALGMFSAEFRDRVSMHGWVEQEALIFLYDSHGIFVAHSLYEGAAKATTEAMARGMVLVSSAVGALKDHVRSGVNGFLCDVGDCEGMAEKLVIASSAIAQAQRIGGGAAETVSKLTWQVCAAASVGFYRELLSAQRT